MIRRRRERDALAVHGDPHRVAHRLEVVERLTHAHQHQVRDQPLLGRAAAPVAEVVAGDEDLADDLGRGQVAHQPLGAGVAEGAGQRAADLARDAERAAILLGDVDGLDLVAAGDPEQVLARAVGRDLPGHHLGPGDGEARREQLAIARGRGWSSPRSRGRRGGRSTARSARRASSPAPPGCRRRSAPRASRRGPCRRDRARPPRPAAAAGSGGRG